MRKGERKAEPVQLRPPAPKGAESILLVEGKMANIQSAIRMIPTSYDLIIARNYEEAMAWLRSTNFNYVLVNLMLPSSRVEEIPRLESRMVTFGLLVAYAAINKCEASRDHGWKGIAVIDECDAGFFSRDHIQLRDRKCRFHLIRPELTPEDEIDWNVVLKEVL